MLGTCNGCHRKVNPRRFVANIHRVLFDIRIQTQLGENDMATSLRQLISLNDQNSLLSGLHGLNPLFRVNCWRAQRYVPVGCVNHKCLRRIY